MVPIVTVADLGAGVQWLAWRLKMPAIVLSAAVGLNMGPGLDLIHRSRLQDQDLPNYAYAGIRRDKPEYALAMLIMNVATEVEFSSSQHSIEPEADETIVCFARAERSSATETVSAPVG